MSVWARFEEEARAKGANLSSGYGTRTVYFPAEVSWHVTYEERTHRVYATEVFSNGATGGRKVWVALDTEALWNAVRGKAEGQ